MSSWSIDPVNLETLLSSVQVEQTSMNAALEEGDFTAIFTGLGSGPDVMGEVQKAVNNLLEDQKNNLTTICSAVAAGVNGVAYAARACAEGNEEMAANVQTQMVRSASSGDFTYFEQLAAQEGQ